MLCRCERRQSAFQMGSSFMCFSPPSWCLAACQRGLFFWNGKGVGGTDAFLSEIWTWVHFRVNSFPPTLAFLGWLTIMLKITSWLHSFISLCLRLISCKLPFFLPFFLKSPSVSFPVLLHCLPSLILVSNSTMAWTVSLYAQYSRLFPLEWEIGNKSQVFLWSNLALLQKKSHFLK